MSEQRDTRTRHLVAALDGAPRSAVTRRAVYISTTGVYGDHGGRRIDETARLWPANERAVRRLDAERLMRRRLRAAVLRVPGIYAHDRLPLDRLRQNLPALADADDVYTNHIHADDLARIAIAALLRGAAARVYNACDNDEMKMAEYFDVVADAFGLPHPPRLPRAELKAAVSPMMYSFMTESRRLSNRRLKEELKIRLLVPDRRGSTRNDASRKDKRPRRAAGMRRRTGFRCVAGAAETTRTSDLLITNQLLYQLSYSSPEANRGLYGARQPAAIFNIVSPA